MDASPHTADAAGPRERLAVVLGTMLEEPIEVTRDLAAFFDTYLSRVPLQAGLGLRIAVWAIVWLPFVFVGRPLPANRLSEELRARYLTKWSGSRLYLLREAFFLVKTVALLGWGADSRVRRRLGITT